MIVSIREFAKNDVPNKVKWINNPNNNKFLHYDLPLDVEKTYKWFENKGKNRYDAIILCDDVPVGLIGLLSIQNGKAEYYITLGEEKYKGKGIAKEASFLLVKYAKDVLKLKSIYLYTEVDNIAAQHLFESVGFVKQCVEKASVINKGKFVDRFYYILKLSQDDFNITPIQKLDNNINNIYIKREDLVSFSFGGNKARKAKYFFKEIDKGEYDTVVTYGSSSSNHCRIVSNMCAARKIPCYIISPKEASIPTYNSRMMNLFNAKIITVSVDEVGATIDEVMNCLKNEGVNPFFIPGGGHGNLGTQAYVDCYNEITKYEKENDIYFDYIFFASGTGTTQAGLVCGQLINNDSRKIVGISIARKNPRGRSVIIDSIKEYLYYNNFSIDENKIVDNTIFVDGYVGLGYGKETDEIKGTIKTLLAKYGIPTDSTYVAKAYKGMIDYINVKKIENKNILFIHTGGTPLFFDDLENI